jgi:hypothetical protein
MPNQWHLSEQFLAHSIVLLSHILTTCVLSDRISFFSGSKYPDEDIYYVRSQVVENFPTLRISPGHNFITDCFFDDKDQFNSYLDKDYIEAICNASDTVMADYPGKDHKRHLTFLSDSLIATRTPITYMPNQFISKNLFPVIAGKALKKKGASPRKSEDILLSIVEDLKRETTQEYNNLRELDIYDINIPSIFSVILREANNPSDIFKIAKQIHKEASSFRKWCTQLNKSQDPMLFLQGIKDAEEELHRLGKYIDSRREERLQITIIPGFLKKSFPVKASTSLEKAFRHAETDIFLRAPIGFLLNLLGSSRQIRSIQEDLVRVFKIPKDMAYRLCVEKLDWIK